MKKLETFKMLKLNKIIVGDCIKVMNELEEDSIDITLTSPPYNIGLKYDGYNDNKGEIEYSQFSKNWLDVLYRIHKQNSRFYLILDDKLIFKLKPIAEEIGWKFHQILVWCKPNIIGGSRIGKDWKSFTEYILLFYKEKRTSMQNSGDISINNFNWFVETCPQSNFKEGRIHPAQLPFKLCKKLLSRTPGDLVLDPFCGSGQVLRAAKSLGKNYIGIEIVECVAERAKLFIEFGTIDVKQGRLF